MIKDIELIIGRKIRGLKDKEIDSIIFETCRVNFRLNKHQLKNNWSYDKESNVLTVKNGNFEAKILFEIFNLVMVAKLWQRGKNKPLPEQVKKPIKLNNVLNIQAARYEFRKAS